MLSSLCTTGHHLLLFTFKLRIETKEFDPLLGQLEKVKSGSHIGLAHVYGLIVFQEKLVPGLGHR